MKALSQFYPFVEPEVMGCPYPVIDHQLRLAMREFCDETRVWKEWLDPVTLDGTTSRFDYDLTQSQELVRVLRASIDGEELDIVDGGSTPADWNEDVPSDITRDTLVHFDTAEYLILPKPTAGGVLLVQMAFRPSLAATQVGDILYTRYAEKVAEGCKARLMAMLGQPWANAAQSDYHARRFARAIADAANDDFARGKTSRRTKPCP